MAQAINAVIASGTKVVVPLINEAEFGFMPDIANNRIIVGLKSINGVGSDLALSLINNRPYLSMEDFYTRMIDTKLVQTSEMISLIEAGAFTELNPDRIQTMREFLKRYVSSPVEQLTLSQLSNMLALNVIPDNLKETVKYYFFQKDIFRDAFLVEKHIDKDKKLPKCGYNDLYYTLDQLSQRFFKEHFTEQDGVVGLNGSYYVVSQKVLSKIIEQRLAPLRDWFGLPTTLDTYNDAVFDKLFNDKAPGTPESWYMSSIGYYPEKHELDGINVEKYGIVDYFSLPEEPENYDYYIKWINGEKKMFPKRKINRIMGTVLAFDNNHSQIALLTTTGTVQVKFGKGQYAFYNQRLSKKEEGSDKKHVIETSWFSRGTKIMVCGYRDGSVFRAYRYNDTIYTHTVTKIVDINNNELIIQNERAKV